MKKNLTPPAANPDEKRSLMDEIVRLFNVYTNPKQEDGLRVKAATLHNRLVSDFNGFFGRTFKTINLPQYV